MLQAHACMFSAHRSERGGVVVADDAAIKAARLQLEDLLAEAQLLCVTAQVHRSAGMTALERLLCTASRAGHAALLVVMDSTAEASGDGRLETSAVEHLVELINDLCPAPAWPVPRFWFCTRPRVALVLDRLQDDDNRLRMTRGRSGVLRACSL